MKLATRYYMDPKIVGLPVDAEVLFLRGLAYAGDQETKGFIPEAVVSQLARNRRPATTVKALVDAGLWKRAKGPHGGYLMPAWSTWQDQLDVLAARRQADRDRKRRKRSEALTMSADGQPADNHADTTRTNSEQRYPLTRDVRGMSADVRALEREEELEPPKGGMPTHDPPAAGPPPRCHRHATIDGPVPPCVACRDARMAWQQAHTNGATPAPPPAVHTPAPFLDIETDGKGIAAAKAALRQGPHT